MIVSFNTAGRKPPLFFVHGLVGLMPLGRFLADSLGDDQPLHVLHADGMDGEKTPLPGSVPEMVARYADQVQAIGAKGPLLVGGMCKGALAAIDLARELRERGEDIGPVILADPPAPPGRSVSPGFWKNFEDPDFMAHLRKRVRAQLEIHAGLEYNTMPFDVADSASLDIAVESGVRCMAALDVHVPQPYPGDIMVIITPERARGFFDPQLYWMGARKNLRLVQVLPCNHVQLFQSSRHDFARSLGYLVGSAFVEGPVGEAVEPADVHAFEGLDKFRPSTGRRGDFPAGHFLRKAQNFFRR